MEQELIVYGDVEKLEGSILGYCFQICLYHIIFL